MRKEKTTQDIYGEVTNFIKTKISGTCCPWKRDYPCFWPVNWVTRKGYVGINYLLLTEDAVKDIAADEPRNYIICPYYATPEQVADSGGRLKEGAVGKNTISFLPVENADFEGGVKLEYCKVYSLLETEGVKGFDYKKWANMPEPEYPLEGEFMASYETVMNIYNPENSIREHIDRVSEGYRNIDEFVRASFVILIHATGESGCLNRFEKLRLGVCGVPGDMGERLITEIGTAMLCDYLGLCSWVTEWCANDLRGWKKVLAKDEQLIFRACEKAQEAVNYILVV